MVKRASRFIRAPTSSPCASSCAGSRFLLLSKQLTVKGSWLTATSRFPPRKGRRGSSRAALLSVGPFRTRPSCVVHHWRSSLQPRGSPMQMISRQVRPLSGQRVLGVFVMLGAGELSGVIERACLINDFIGVGLGLTAVDPAHVLTLHDVPRVAEAPMVGIGAGTGLGEVLCRSACSLSCVSSFQVYLTCAGTEGVYSAWPSEGGMSEFNAHSKQVPARASPVCSVTSS